MPNIYVRSSDGLDADNGSTWALAKATLAGGIAAAVAGDTLFVSKNFSVSSAAATTYAFVGGPSNPFKVISVEDAGDPEPPTALASGASVDTGAGAYTLTINGSCYFSNMRFRAGVAGNSSSASLRLNLTDNDTQTYDNCTLTLSTTGNSTMDFGASSANTECTTTLRNTSLGFAAVGQRVRCFQKLRWEGGGIAAGSSAITGLFGNASVSGGVDVVVSGVDLSLGAAAMDLIATSMTQYGQILFRNIKLPASWTGKLLAGAPTTPGFRAVMHNATSGATVYPMWEEDYAGKTVHESVVKKTAGANDGADYSWKVTTNATSSYPVVPHRTPELPALWVATVGTPITIEVDIVRDSATALTNGEIALEIQYPGDAGAITTQVSSAKATVLATAANLDASAATWTTTGLTTPNKQKLAVTVTLARAGFIQGAVLVYKPSTTVYIDPKITVS